MWYRLSHSHILFIFFFSNLWRNTSCINSHRVVKLQQKDEPTLSGLQPTALTTLPEDGQCGGDLHGDKNVMCHLLVGQISPKAWLEGVEKAVPWPSPPSVTFEKEFKTVTAMEFCRDRVLPACGRMLWDLRAVPLQTSRQAEAAGPRGSWTTRQFLSKGTASTLSLLPQPSRWYFGSAVLDLGTDVCLAAESFFWIWP